MKNTIDAIKLLFQEFNTLAINRIEKIPQSGSDRIYFRIYCENNNTYIATYSNNVKENNAFIYFSKHFKNAGAPVPQVYAVNKTCDIYIQEDFGNNALLDVLEKEGPSDLVYDLFKKSLIALANLQISGDKNLDYAQCITSKEFGQQAIMSDLLYFKYYFLKSL